MTLRFQLLHEFRANESGLITAPGKFEGEPIYAPYFWDQFLQGMADEDDGEWVTFEITAQDEQLFPELKGIQRVRLYEDDVGFVHCEAA